MIIAAILLVPIIPFLLLGEGFETQIEEWFKQDHSSTFQFGLIVLLLSVDIFLPIPSSAISTYAGGVLGTLPAALASWIGMSLGAISGFAVARWGGAPIAKKFSKPDDLERLKSLTQEHGVTTLLLTRPLPILAEAAVLLVGTTRLSWSKFLPPVLVANLMISIVYAAFGEFFAGRNALMAAIVISLFLPLIFALIVRAKLKKKFE